MYKTFYSADDVNGSIEIQYDPETQKFREIKTFDDGTRTELTAIDYEMTERIQDAFDAAFEQEE